VVQETGGEEGRGLLVFFIVTVFSNVHKGNNAANLRIPITQIQQTNLDVAAFALSFPFFLFFFILFAEVVKGICKHHYYFFLHT